VDPETGIVGQMAERCLGCRYCMAACPYDAIFINPEDHSAEKCNFCAHRIDVGLEPACVVVCPTQAILIGDMNDQTSYVAQIVSREAVNVRRPEKETLPKLFYKGAHQATLDPLAARRPEAGLFMWSEQRESPEHVVSGNPTYSNSSAAALLSYDVAHSIPWDWRVSLYTWTKGIASGVYLVAALLQFFGLISFFGALWLWVAPIVSGAFLGLTGLLLIWDLEHPERFYMIFTKRQWKSWLVKGAFIIFGYTIVLLLHFLASIMIAISSSTSVNISQATLMMSSLQSVLTLAGVPLAVLTAVYTAYLFAQAKARDLWQNPLLPPHLVCQSVLLGAAVLLPFAAYFRIPGLVSGVSPLLWTIAITSLIHVLMVWGEISLTHPTSHARVAVWEMTSGRYRGFFWPGLLLSAVGGLLPWIVLLSWFSFAEPAPQLPAILGIASVPFVLAGLLLHEHAYVQAGQSVPLA